jgi:hypothetical protein
MEAHIGPVWRDFNMLRRNPNKKSAGGFLHRRFSYLRAELQPFTQTT